MKETLLLFPSCPPEKQSSNTTHRLKERFLIVHLPSFRLERCGFTNEECAALYASRKNALRLVSLTSAGLAAGLRKNMTITEARALCPEVRLELLNVMEEEQDRQELKQALHLFSDRVQLWWETEWVVDISRTTHLFGGETALSETIQKQVETWGHFCRIAIADEPWAAAVWASAGEGGVIPAGHSRQFLAPLSFEALRPSQRLFRATQALDIQTVEQWAALDPASVAGRFGVEGLRLHQIACGVHRSHTLNVEENETAIVVQDVLIEPARTLAPIEWVLRQLIHEVAHRLEMRNLFVTQIRIHLLVEMSSPVLLRVRMGRPTRNSEKILRLCTSRLERVRLPSPVSECIVEVEQAVPELLNQADLFDRRQVSDSLPDVVARLVDILGPNAVFKTFENTRWRPEAAWEPLAVGVAPPSSVRPVKKDPVGIQEGKPCFIRSSRPSWWVDPPMRLELCAHQEQPVRLKWDGRWFDVQRCEGPECIRAEWWFDDGGVDRMYWILDIEVGSCWVYEDQRGIWWLQGWFD